MKIAFITTVFEQSAVGPARFANKRYDYFQSIPTVNFDVFYTEKSNKKDVIHIPISNADKSSILNYFSISKKINVFLQENMNIHSYDCYVFNDAIYGYHFIKNNPKTNTFAFINDEDLIVLSKGISPRALKMKFFRNLQKSSAQNASTCIVNSEYIRSVVQSEYKVSPSKIKRLYKGINLDDFTYSKPPIHIPEVVHVLFVKNNYKRGGLITLIHALNALTSYSFKLTIAGPEKDVEQIIINLANEKLHIEFFGQQHFSEIVRLLHKSHIFCVPSKSEALGVANIEAMAYGVPVVTTNIGGIPEVTNNGALAWVCEPNSVTKLAHQIELCLRENQTRVDKTVKARAYVESNFDEKSMFLNLMKILNEK